MELAEERAFIEEVDLWVAAAWEAGRVHLPSVKSYRIVGFTGDVRMEVVNGI